MSEKRFTSQRTDDYNFSDILDNGNWVGICHVDCEDDFVNLLNKLGEENKDLEEARSYYQENFLTMKTERNHLKEENKRFKDKCEFMEKILENKGYTVEYDIKKDKWVLE